MSGITVIIITFLAEREKKPRTTGSSASREPIKARKEYRKNWAQLIQKIYENDPLICPKCRGVTRIISFIEDREVIKSILKHLGLWLIQSRPIPQAHAPSLLNDIECFYR